MEPLLTTKASVSPVMPANPSSGTFSPLDLSDVQLRGGFWGERQGLNRTAILGHAAEWMTTLGWVQNFRDAASGKEYKHRGMQFADSEVYKLIEALSWTLHGAPDPQLQEILEDLIDAVSGAQDPDGYLHTLYGRSWQRPRYSDFAWGHELYCFGHFIQAAVAHHRTTGTDHLLNRARHLADHVCTMFGHNGLKRICGHPEIEMALVELYRVTGVKKYLDQANLLIDRRGYASLPRIEFGTSYWQDAVPLRDSNVLHGHAVRALYLAAGAVDAAVESDDSSLLEAIIRQWESTVARRTYITGGMGSHHMDEAFGEDFVLPADRSYCETCAGVASIMLSWRLLLATGEARFAELIERTLFNVIATSPSADGKSFFYANTLHQRSPQTEASQNEEGVAIRGGSIGRQAWFEVSCCPPNLARTLGSLHGYVASKTERGVYLHQLVSADVSTTLSSGEHVRFSVDTIYPEDGLVKIMVHEAPTAGVELSVRIPSWALESKLDHSGQQLDCHPGNYTTLLVGTGDRITLTLPISTRASFPDPRIDAVRGTVAFERGPEVLALESIDLPENWSLDDVLATGRVADTESGPMVELTNAVAETVTWPFGPPAASETQPTVEVPLIRYHEWAERGPSAMRVFTPLTLHR